ncbi:hypothetical protein [Nocardioides litoris]|uniref:hypothetical protein n=1 Tax=Nocardioides litoris TaxID=1926648 RepID=UPI001121BA50|nr:hypothetical protein [Nocardioides litoris]
MTSSTDHQTTSTGEDPADGRDEAHRRPAGVDDATVEALGKLSAALDHVEEARGLMYAFHRRMGAVDRVLGEATEKLREAGLEEWVQEMEREALGRNPLPGMWSFQMVEHFDDGFWEPLKDIERRALAVLVGGRRHLFEAEMKDLRRTTGLPGHEALPEDAHD